MKTCRKKVLGHIFHMIYANEVGENVPSTINYIQMALFLLKYSRLLSYAHTRFCREDIGGIGRKIIKVKSRQGVKLKPRRIPNDPKRLQRFVFFFYPTIQNRIHYSSL